MKYQHFWMMCAAAGATVVVIGGAATAALAQQVQTTTIVGTRPADEGNRMIVSYRDLNLAAASDERILNRRVGGAAKSVCHTDDFKIGERAQGKCVSYAWNGARPQIARAVQRAREIASTGSSSIPLVAISVVGLR